MSLIREQNWGQLVECYQDLDEGAQRRLLGYMEGLVEQKKEKGKGFK